MSKNLKIKLTVDADGNIKGVLTDTNKQIDKFENKAHDAGEATNKLTQTVHKFAAVAVGAFAVNKLTQYTREIISVADGYKSMTGQIDLVTESHKELLTVQTALHSVAVETRANVSDLTKLYSALSPTFKAMGKDTQDSINLIEIYNKSLALTSPNLQQSSAATLQFAQAMGSGVMRGDEFNSMMENGRGVMMMLAEGMNVPIGSLRAMAEQGLLTADVVVAALEKQAAVVEDKFTKIPLTVGSAMQVANTEFMMFVGHADESLGATESLAEGIVFLSQNIDEAAYLIKVGLVGAITAKAIPAMYGMATATTVASAANVSLIATTKAATAAALAFTLTPIGAAMTLIAGGAAYLALKEDEAKLASDELTKSLEAQNIELSKAEIKIKAQELVNYREQLERLTQAKSQNSAIDIFDIKENRLKRAISVLLSGITEVNELTKGNVGLDLQGEIDAQLAALDKLENAKLDKELDAAIREEEQQAKTYKVKEGLLARLFDLTASEAEKRQAILLTLSDENKLLQQRIWLAEDAEKNKPKAATGDWSSMLDEQTGGFDQEAETLQGKIDSLTDSTNEFGEAWTRTGDKVIDAMSSVGQVLEKTNKKESDYAKKSLKIQNMRADNDEVNAANFSQWKANEIKLTAQQDKLEKERVTNSLQGSLAMLDASVAMFEEGTEAQKIAHQASLVFHSIEMAMNIQKAISAATVSVASQGQGDPYTAWARIAGMSVMMAGLISQIGASFGGAGGSAPASVKAVAGPDSSPLGSSDPSQSITNTYDMLLEIEADNYAALRDINQEMKSLNSNITGVVSSLYRTGDLSELSQSAAGSYDYVGKSFFESITETMGSLDPLNPITKMLTDIGGNLNAEVMSGLFGSTKKSVSDYGIGAADFKLGGDLDLLGYKTITTSKDGGWFRKSSKSSKDQYSDISGETENLLNMVFDDLRDSAIELGSLLDRSVQEQVDDFTVSIANISLDGKSNEEIQKDLQQALSQQTDDLAYGIFDDLVDSYRKLNEGAFETVSRLALEKSVVSDVISMTGQELVGDSIALSQSLINIAGGLDELKGAADDYYSSFFSESEQSLRNQERLTEALSQQNLALPAARREYRDLAESLNLGTEAGQEQYITLMKLSDAADSYYSYIEEAQRDYFDTQIEMVQTTLSAYQSLKDSLSNTYDSIVGSLVSDSLSYINAQNTLSSALDSARAGDIPELESISDALSILSNNSESNYANYSDFQRDQMITANMLDELMGYTDSAITVEDAMLQELERQTAALENLTIVGIDQSMDGSHFDGLYSVPFDGYRATLHKNESVIDADSMNTFRKYGISANTGSSAAVVFELKALRDDFNGLEDAMRAGFFALADHAVEANEILEGWNQGGIPETRPPEEVTV